MAANKLSREIFEDKVLGCWMGKNIGGTLGAPLEKSFGEEEPFDVWWYPRLQPGGIPNDDLEIQLIWLKALEQVGMNLKADDLARYWQDHIQYNYDEYGLHKTNLRLGLKPPVSGAFNNWFVDCMGCPIRCEIWACAAAGNPHLAAKLAYEDAIIDHAGGESVYGELFNVTIEAAAFIVSDRETLLDIGRSYVPNGSKTAKAIDAARQAHREGLTWQQARKRVLEATPHYNSQYSPINMGFQVVGWLYGNDFADALCKAVNCGYDTDCTGATLGSILGIIEGGKALPAKWVEPLGDDIATAESWGGLLPLDDEDWKAPRTVTALTERVLALATVPEMVNVEQLYADEASKALGKQSTTAADYRLGDYGVTVDYRDTPAVVPGQTKRVTVSVSNPHRLAVTMKLTPNAPKDWRCEPAEMCVRIAPKGQAQVELAVHVPTEPAKVAASNVIQLTLEPEQRPAPGSLPVVLVGSRAWRVTGPIKPAEAEAVKWLSVKTDVEDVRGELTQCDSRASASGGAGAWQTVYSQTNAMPTEGWREPGIYYFQGFFKLDRAMDLWMGVPATCPTVMWLDGSERLRCADGRRLRPNYPGDGSSYFDQLCEVGWHEVLIKLVRLPGEGNEPTRAHYMMSDIQRLATGVIEAEQTYMPWED